ncbi:MAG TPA: hypothetical protein VFV08_14220 [Puia sp.]|nr:hypothetical protein [Puia sp.]
MAAGYSGTPLINKLGLKDQMKILLINPPSNYFSLLESDLSRQTIKVKEIPDWIHLFAPSEKEFISKMQSIKKYQQANPSIVIWVSWYKKSAGIATDLNENIIRDYALKNELVDIKVCAVSDLWSGLKLVVPVAKRSLKK